MQVLSIQQSLSLPAGQIRSFLLASPVELHITHGFVWLTISGMAEDYWMSEGDAVLLPTQRKVVVEAHKADSVLQLIEVAKPVPHSAPKPAPRHACLVGKLECQAVQD